MKEEAFMHMGFAIGRAMASGATASEIHAEVEQCLRILDKMKGSSEMKEAERAMTACAKKAID